MEETTSLFERREGRHRGAHRAVAATVAAGICLIWWYRAAEMPAEEGGRRRWAWIGIFFSELLFGFYWIITQSLRWRLTYNFPFMDNLSIRYNDDQLPNVDVFVCTADPIIEPPIMVISTVLSAMAYDYPTEKLAIYLSDDGGSELTFYALIEASNFSKHWLPFCRKFMVEPRSPEAYFYLDSAQHHRSQEWVAMKKLYDEMKERINSVVEMGKVPKEIRDHNKGFSEWDCGVTKQNHQSIVKIIVDGKNDDAVDVDGYVLPKLVYMSREKRPRHPHHFKAGAMNALIRVSSEISNAPFILNLDCDMYSNNPDTIKESLCFFLDRKKSHDIAFVQFPQDYNNVTKNKIYGIPDKVSNEIDLVALDGYGAALYCGTGCFHRRETLCGKKYSKDVSGSVHLDVQTKKEVAKTVYELEEACKLLVDCNFENGSQWGKEMGLIYGCPVEDIVTGLTIQCRGWRSVYYNPKKRAFLGVAPISLDVALVQFKRWSEGMFQIFLSKYCPFIYAHGKIKFGAQMGYCVYLLWAPLSIPMLYYATVPAICLLQGIPLFPEVKSLWAIPFAYVFVTHNCWSIAEAITCGSTLKAWWNLQRMLLFRRTTAFFFAFIDTIIKQLGLSQTKFAVTAKVAAEDVSKRYEQEILEFGSSAIMPTIIATLAMLNLFGLLLGIIKNVAALDLGLFYKGLNRFFLQTVVCGLIVLANLPTYEALFIRRDKGRLPPSVLFKSVSLALLASVMVY
ncbi:cellulose synthase-like protein E6 [Momordica charantia]|uniref:Cellulose synthase-like protein E6 n=1 Tax=Momordica charantia TaxID=3673 RepID=A0A6J1CDW3_MOMCH|nr:cellulose synthase-like protein E6 [Momordica charantia]